MISPPVFLSEEEALQVITEELSRHGLSFPERNVTVDSVEPPSRMKSIEWVVDPSGTSTRKMPDGSRIRGEWIEKTLEAQGKPFSMDARDPEKKVAFEFVSRGDYGDLGGPGSCSTVRGYDLPAVSRELARRMSESGEPGLRFGILYDPMPSMDLRSHEDHKAARKRLEGEARELLKKQVTDFVDWLKAQGAI